jgi:hypothetical protein
VCLLIHKVTGEQVSHATIWKLRNGQQDNPQIRVIGALARTSGVEPGFIFDDYDTTKLGLMQEQSPTSSGASPAPGPRNRTTARAGTSEAAEPSASQARC